MTTLKISEMLMLDSALKTAKRMAMDIGSDDQLNEIIAAQNWLETTHFVPDHANDGIGENGVSRLFDEQITQYGCD